MEKRVDKVYEMIMTVALVVSVIGNIIQLCTIMEVSRQYKQVMEERQ